jgi:hypothetical protein
MKKLNLKGLQKGIPFLAGAAGGYIAGAFVAPKIPLQNPMIKNGLMLAGGALLFGMAKKKDGVMAGVGAGLFTYGTTKVVGGFLPTLGISGAQIAGQSSYIMIEAEPVGKPVNGAQIAGGTNGSGYSDAKYY